MFAADGTRLGFIQSDQLRTPVSWSEIPTEPEERDGRDRGPALLQEQRRRPDRDLPRGRQGHHPRQGAAGRLDDHDAARAQPLPRRRPAHAQAEDHRGQAGDRVREAPRQALDPHQLPQQRPLRHARRADGDRRAGGLADLLRQTGLAAEPAAVGAARRPAPGALPVQPVPRRARWPSAGATRCSRRWPNCTTSPPRRPPPPRPRRWKSSAATSTPSARRTSSSNTCASSWSNATARATVAQGGLKVHTTIDLNMQSQARKAIASVLNEPEDPAAAIVTINPANGDIEAMAESQSYEESQYNLASQGHRQPGSTFKAIVLADALSRGIDPEQHLLRLAHAVPGWLTGYPTYEVKTFGGEQNGTINLVQATLKSDNTVYAQLAADLGESTVTEMAHKMGVVSPLHSYAAEALGGLTLGRHAAGDGQRVRDARRRRLAQQPDRDHQSRLPGRSRGQQLGQAAPREGAQRRRDRRGDEHPRTERAERHRRALGDQLPDGRQDRHDQRTRRRVARRLHAQLLDGRVDGLSDQTRLDDQTCTASPSRAATCRRKSGTPTCPRWSKARPASRSPRPRNRSPTSPSTANSRRPGSRESSTSNESESEEPTTAKPEPTHTIAEQGGAGGPTAGARGRARKRAPDGAARRRRPGPAGRAEPSGLSSRRRMTAFAAGRW